MYTRIAIDCSSLLFGGAYKLKQLKAREVHTGAIFNFMRNLLFLAQYFHCNRFMFCWDSKGSDRRKIFPEYKSGRKKKRKDDPALDAIYQSVFEQSDKLKNDILPRCGFRNSFEQNGKEADDILASIVMYYEGVLVVSNDEDMFQILDLCDIWNNNKQKLWSERSFLKEYRITPTQWIDVKSIGGCGSDEIPGVSGVAEKTAIKYLLGELPQHHKTYSAIQNSAELIKRNRKLVELPIDGTDIFKPVKDELDHNEFVKICRELWFNSFLDAHCMDWENFFEGRV